MRRFARWLIRCVSDFMLTPRADLDKPYRTGVKCHDCDGEAVGLMAICSQCAQKIIQEGADQLREMGMNESMVADYEHKLQADVTKTSAWRPSS